MYEEDNNKSLRVETTLNDVKKIARQESLQAVGMMIEKQIVTNNCVIARTCPVQLYYIYKKSNGKTCKINAI